jgi:hypothetical protein
MKEEFLLKLKNKEFDYESDTGEYVNLLDADKIANYWLSLLEQEKIKWLKALPKEKRFKDRDVRNASDFGWNSCLQTIKQQLTK